MLSAERIEELLARRPLAARLQFSTSAKLAVVEIYRREELPPVLELKLEHRGWYRDSFPEAPLGVAASVHRHMDTSAENYRRTRELIRSTLADRIDNPPEQRIEIIVIDPKREYCGPYLLALPAPSWWRAYIPSVPPFRIRYTRLDNGMQYSQGEFKDMRVACSRLWDISVDDEHIAEVVDAKGDWIMRIGPPQSLGDGQ